MAVQLLLERGADINAQGGTYGNALQASAQDGGVEIVQLMLERGADVNAPGSVFGNALQATAFINKTDVVQLLLQNGADKHGRELGDLLQAAEDARGLSFRRLSCPAIRNSKSKYSTLN